MIEGIIVIIFGHWWQGKSHQTFFGQVRPLLWSGGGGEHFVIWITILSPKCLGSLQILSGPAIQKNVINSDVGYPYIALGRR